MRIEWQSPCYGIAGWMQLIGLSFSLRWPFVTQILKLCNKHLRGIYSWATFFLDMLSENNSAAVRRHVHGHWNAIDVCVWWGLVLLSGKLYNKCITNIFKQWNRMMLARNSECHLPLLKLEIIEVLGVGWSSREATMEWPSFESFNVNFIIITGVFHSIELPDYWHEIH